MAQTTPPLEVAAQAVHLIADALDDDNNALGQSPVAGRAGAYGALVPSLLNLAGTLKGSPGEALTLSGSERQQLANVAVERLGVPPANGWAVAGQILSMLATIVGAVVRDTTGIASLVKALR